VVGGLPWVLVAPWAAARAWRGELPRRYALVWAATVSIFFSLAPLKRAAYLLPLRPALALVVGWWLAEVTREEQPATRLVGAARTLVVAVAAGGVLAAVTALAVGHGLVSAAGSRDVALRHEIDAEAYRRALTAQQAEIVGLALATAVAAGLAAGRGSLPRATTSWTSNAGARGAGRSAGRRCCGVRTSSRATGATSCWCGAGRSAPPLPPDAAHARSRSSCRSEVAEEAVGEGD